MPQAPDWFKKDLKNLDPLLRIRWSDKRSLWMIERQIAAALHPGTIKSDTESDEWIRARDGYVLVGCVQPGNLTPHVFAVLRASDLWPHGWKKYADQIEAWEQMQEEKSWERFSSNLIDASKDVYEILKIRDGRTVFNAGWI